MAITHIETVELSGSQSSVLFNSISQDFSDLLLVASARTDRSVARDNIRIQPNSNANAATGTFLTGYDGGLLSTGGGVSSPVDLVVPGGVATSNTFSSSRAYIPNYTSNLRKIINTRSTQENNATSGGASYAVGTDTFLHPETSPITSLLLVPATGPNFVSGSTFSLYGITAGGDGTVTTS